MLWLVETNFFNRIQAAYNSEPKPTSDLIEKFKCFADGSAKESSSIMSVNEKGLATLNVTGALTREPDFWLWLFGIPQTTYADIISAVSSAESNADIKSMDVVFDSPGGSVSGLFEATEALRNFSKPTRAIIDDMAASAAYGLAAQADTIEAKGKMAMRQ